MILLSEMIASLMAGLLLGERRHAGPLALLTISVGLAAAAMMAGRGDPHRRRSRWSWRVLTMASLLLAGWARSPGPDASGDADRSARSFRPASEALPCLDPVRAIFEDAAKHVLSGNALSLYRG